MADDATEHGTFAQNAELDAAALADAFFDAPTWAYNKATGSSVPAPSHLASHVYVEQTSGAFTDSAGNVLTDDQVQTATDTAEDAGGVVDAATQTAQDIADHPLDVIPTWTKIAIGVLVVGVVGLYVVQGAAAFKALKASFA